MQSHSAMPERGNSPRRSDLCSNHFLQRPDDGLEGRVANDDRPSG
jgi:hypothetical protein